MRYFELKNDSRLQVQLPSGRTVVFYKGHPGQVAISDERDLRLIKSRPDTFFEVVEVVKNEATKETIWLPVEEAEELIQRRVATRQAARQAAQTAKTNQDVGTPAVPSAPVTTGDPSPADAGKGVATPPPPPAPPAGKKPKDEPKKAMTSASLPKKGGNKKR